ITLAPRLISRATSVSQVVNRVGSGLGVAIVATILSDRIEAHLPPLPRGASASAGGGLAAVHLPPAVKSVLLAQVARGFDDTFWVMAGLTLLCFPMALLLRRPLPPRSIVSPRCRRARADAARSSYPAREAAPGRSPMRPGA